MSKVSLSAGPKILLEACCWCFSMPGLTNTKLLSIDYMLCLWLPHPYTPCLFISLLFGLFITAFALCHCFPIFLCFFPYSAFLWNTLPQSLMIKKIYPAAKNKCLCPLPATTGTNESLINWHGNFLVAEATSPSCLSSAALCKPTRLVLGRQPRRPKALSRWKHIT